MRSEATISRSSPSSYSSRTLPEASRVRPVTPHRLDQRPARTIGGNPAYTAEILLTPGGRPMKVSLACCAVLVAFAVLAPSASAAPGKRDNQPPTTPTNVRVVSVTEETITIAWNAIVIV